MLLARCLLIAAVLCAAVPSAAAATTWSVSPTGSDLNPGTEEHPFRTISRAAATASDGDTVLVASGVYRETVSLHSRHSGVTFRGVGDARPVIDGGGRPFGFANYGAARLTIEDFELRRQTDAAIYTSGTEGLITGNLIHHVGSSSQAASNGVRVSRGNGTRVVGNTVHHIGPGQSSIGIWLLETRDALVEDNAVYFVRKEGIRDWKGLDNTIVGNRLFLNWLGIALNTSTGSIVRDNHVHDNVEGIAVKHASYSRVLDHWGLSEPHWSRVLHNSVGRSSEASLWIAQSGEPLDYVEVRENLFAGAGAAFLRDIPSLRGPDVVVDANAYSNDGGSPRWLYKAGWGSDPGLTDWESVRQETGWETTTAPADAGARVTHPIEATWAAFPMRPVHASSPGSYYTGEHIDATSDGDQSTYWLTESNENEFVVFDFGQARTFNHLVLTLYSHNDLRNPRGYRFAVSDDGSSWRTVRSGVNEDPSQAARYYELGEPVTARYLRFTMVDTFCEWYTPRLGCGERFVLSDLAAGLLGPVSAAPAPQPADDPSGAGLLDLLPLPELRVAPTARLTSAGGMRLRVRYAGEAPRITRLAVSGRRGAASGVRWRRLGRARIRLAPSEARAVEIALGRRVRRALRRGEFRVLRLTAKQRGSSPVTKRLRLRR